MSQIKPEQIIRVKLDLVKGWENKQYIEIKQSDNDTRYLLIRLTNLLPMNITGYQPTLMVKRADGLVLSALCQVIQNEKGEFIVPLSNNFLKVIGTISFEVVLVKDGTQILSFPQFTMQVVESLHDDVEFNPDDEELSILWDIINRMETTTAKLENEFQEFKGQKETEFQSFIAEKDNEFQVKETERQVAEIDRQQAEEERRKEFAIMEEKVDKVYDSTITLSYIIVE